LEVAHCQTAISISVPEDLNIHW